ncbi:hypothetical protein HBN50_03250 [Halobacteriovorax sp. GB3]|uniref:hypothetical protein n=1 Tax=Halobacteriovorax sp. GB3 TaxID=2719615 RepID=UPI00235E039A|nr:hypothetical protein [Halobacteriovorax sp. GB3]MDD0852093.1 hypothetical protein [Halobacteriovorax sp. GB3]
MNLKKLTTTATLALILLVNPAYSKNSGIKSTLSLETFQRLNDPQQKTSTTEWVGASLKGKSKLFHLDSALDTDLRVYLNDDKDINFSIAEAYVESSNGYDKSISVGRKLLDWNINEHYWMLGNMNGLQGMQLLSEKQEGLIGLHAERTFDTNFKVSIFFSYFNIPALNPGLDVKDGKITSNSEWVRRPPEYTVVKGKLVPIRYDINMPGYDKLVLKKSLGIRQSYKWEDGEISSFFIYKPENKVRVNAEAKLVEENGGYFVDVTANPIVNHHMIYGVQLRQDFGDVKTITGFDITDPNARLGKDFDVLDPVKLEEAQRTYKSEYFDVAPNYDRESYFHSTAYINRDTYDLLFGYIQILSDNIRGSDDFYSETVKWKQAFGGKIRYFFSDDLQLSADIKYDISRKDQIVKAEVFYRFMNSAAIKVGAELIKSPQDNSYWSAYRAHDTIYSNLSYTF